MKLYDQNADRDDDDLRVLYDYYEKTETEVRKVLNSIEERLKNSEDIDFIIMGNWQRIL